MDNYYKRSGRILVWYFMLNKRLFHKWSFIIILAIAPVIAGVMSYLSGGDRGVLKVTIYSPVELECISELCNGRSVILFDISDSEQQAIDKVKCGEYDAAWIFDKDYYDIIASSVKQYKIKPLIRVIEREDTISLKMSREKLYSAVYSDINYSIYNTFVVNELNITGEEQINSTYNQKLITDNLFQMVYVSGEETESNDNYLLTPVRGMLAAWMVLFGLVSCMYYMQDKNNGLFDRFSSSGELLYEIGYHLVLLADAAVCLLASIYVSGLATSFLNEIKCMAVFIIVTALYCGIVGRICARPQIIGILLPIITVIMLGLSPVFFSLKEFAYFRYINPTYMYLVSIHSDALFYEMVIYGIVLCVIYCILYKLKGCFMNKKTIN